VSDWLSWSFAVLPYFSGISMVYQGFYDKSDGIPAAIFFEFPRRDSSIPLALFRILCAMPLRQHYTASDIIASSPSGGVQATHAATRRKIGSRPHPVVVQRRRTFHPVASEPELSLRVGYPIHRGLSLTCGLSAISFRSWPTSFLGLGPPSHSTSLAFYRAGVATVMLMLR
jgi:hypothetical protein